MDAYNNENVRHFYEKNGFKLLYQTEEQEKEANHIPVSDKLTSRMMYLDLLRYVKKWAFQMNTLEEVSTHNTRKEKSFSNSSDNADEFIFFTSFIINWST